MTAARSTSLALILAFVGPISGCNRPTGEASSDGSAPGTSPIPSATVTGSTSKALGCLHLKAAIGEAARAAPRACKTNAECELAGPTSCKNGDETQSCMIGVAKGHGRMVNAAADEWREGGCEQGLKEAPNETPVCRAGTCAVVRR